MTNAEAAIKLENSDRRYTTKIVQRNLSARAVYSGLSRRRI
jgi:hypothetical protein